MNELELEHFVVTRFNVTTGFTPPGGLGPEWVRTRLGFFRHFTAPSLGAQTEKGFTWLCAIDPATPGDVRKDIVDIAASSALRAVLVEAPRPFHKAVARYIVDHARAPYVTTTRLDNDDALGRRYIESLRQHAATLAPAPLRFIEFPHGFSYNVATGRLGSVSFQGAAFPSCIEERASALTIYQGHHGKLAERGPVTAAHLAAAWMEVIHGGNVKNHDRRTAQPVLPEETPAVLAEEFGVRPWPNGERGSPASDARV